MITTEKELEKSLTKLSKIILIGGDGQHGLIRSIRQKTVIIRKANPEFFPDCRKLCLSKMKVEKNYT
jgi:preprotein translocase subunit YajC